MKQKIINNPHGLTIIMKRLLVRYQKWKKIERQILNLNFKGVIFNSSYLFYWHQVNVFRLCKSTKEDIGEAKNGRAIAACAGVGEVLGHIKYKRNSAPTWGGQSKPEFCIAELYWWIWSVPKTSKWRSRCWPTRYQLNNNCPLYSDTSKHRPRA